MYASLFNWSWSRSKPAPNTGNQLEASIFTVRQGKRYRATVVLSWMESFADNDTIAAKLREVGFQDVLVTGSGNTRQAEGTWPGPDQSAALDPHLTRVTEIA